VVIAYVAVYSMRWAMRLNWENKLIR